MRQDLVSEPVQIEPGQVSTGALYLPFRSTIGSWQLVSGCLCAAVVASSGNSAFAWQNKAGGGIAEPSESMAQRFSDRDDRFNKPAAKPAAEKAAALAEEAIETAALNKTLQQAERLSESKTPEDEFLNKSSLLSRARSLLPGKSRTTELQRLSQAHKDDRDFVNARDAALEIDKTDQREKVRTLVSLAKAEAAADNLDSAWWTLHEAQQTALKMKNSQDVIGVMRELGETEQLLRAKSGALKADGKRLNPAPNEVIQKVMAHGTPPAGYREIEILAEGGGALRQPMEIYHPYFYNGDRYFQGPMLRGGPTNVHVMHPRCGCAATVTVNMPTGAPIVQYSPHMIEYFFPEVVLELDFDRSGKVKVDYRQTCNQYSMLRHKLENRSSFGSRSSGGLGDTGEAISNLGNVAVGGKLDVLTRLPVLSSVLGRPDNRISNTLKSPAAKR